MVVHISTIDEVRDMLIKLNINERDVHKVLSSLQMRENWLQYLSQKIEDGETATTPQASTLDHDEIDGNLDTMIRQHSDPSSPSMQPHYKPDLLSASGFLGETYTPAASTTGPTTHSRENPSFSSSESRHKRETHVCNTLGPNPKVMIAHLGTKEIHDESLAAEPSSMVQPRSSTVSSNNSMRPPRVDGCVTVEESLVEDDENSSAAASLHARVMRGGRSTSSSSSSSNSSSSSESSSESLQYPTAGNTQTSRGSYQFDSPEHALVKDLSATHIPADIKVYVVSSANLPNPKFCVNVMTESLKKKVLSTSGLAFFTRSCAMRASQ